MLEYPTQEALTLLREKLAASQKSISELELDLGFLREQITTVEVNMARIYNWNVKKKK